MRCLPACCVRVSSALSLPLRVASLPVHDNIQLCLFPLRPCFWMFCVHCRYDMDGKTFTLLGASDNIPGYNATLYTQKR